MKKILILTIVLLAFAFDVMAQVVPTLPKGCEAFLPKILLETEVLKESDANQLTNDPTWGQNDDPGEGRRKYWIAYSDRQDNPTYYSPSFSSKKYKSLRLSERVIIARIDRGYALVYSEPQHGRQWPAISKDAECKGWVPMSKLLLWSTCLANEHGIYNKALLCLNLDQTQSRKNDLGVGYTNPDKRDGSNSQYRVRLKTDMDFFFIMKRLSDGRVLLAKQNKMTGLSNEVLSFWVDESSYIAWSQRSCIEPTWNPQDVENFVNNGYAAKIYEDNSRVKSVSRVSYSLKSGTDPSRYRMEPTALRYPLLDGGTDDMYKCSVFSALGGQATSLNEHYRKQAEKAAMQEASMEKLRNIKLAIVIDGTKSMEKYFPAVKRAIINACNYFADNKYRIKVAVVIYRDYADGEGLVEKCNWADPDDPRIFSFLDNGGQYRIRSSSSDATHTEALYYGLNYAIDELRFDKNESNLILVVGDCANAEDDMRAPTPESISQKLVRNKIHFLGFQVRNFPRMADFSNFNDQMCMLLQDNLNARYGALKRGETAEFEVPEDGLGYIFKNKNSDLLVGAHKFYEAEDEMDASKLTDLMVNSIKFCASAIEAQLNVVNRGYVVTDETTMFDPTDKNLQRLDIDNRFLEERLGKDYVEKVKYLNSLITFAGYTPKKAPGGRDYYKPVIFISKEELNALMNKLRPVDEVARMRDYDAREKYVEAMKALVRSMIPDITEEEIGNMSNTEIMGLANGLNEKSQSLKGYTLDDIVDENKVTKETYRDVLEDFQNKYRKLRTIQQTGYKFSYNFNGSTYYWIPIEDLP